MSDMSPIVRGRIEAQGFLGLDDQMIKQVNYWLRLSPAICMIWAAIGTALQSATVLWLLVPFALLGALLPGHPFDLLYTHGVRYVTGGPRLPRYPLPRRFACLLATLMLVVAWCFQSGRLLSGQIVGWTLVAAAFVNVSTGFCIPSFIYGLIFGRPTSCGVK
ncbi:MAG: DUF4395 family protein [Nitrospira defluvii]|nr:DUF4395 family protein [Nitrospira defluvii]